MINRLNIKKVIFWGLISYTFALAGCGKPECTDCANDNKTLQGNLKFVEYETINGESHYKIIKNVTDEVDEIRVVAGRYEENITIAETAISNGEFSLILPTLGNEILDHFTDNDGEIIDPSARFTGTTFLAYKNKELVGTVVPCLPEPSYFYLIYFMYASKDYLINANCEDANKGTLKKGWNMTIFLDFDIIVIDNKLSDIIWMFSELTYPKDTDQK